MHVTVSQVQLLDIILHKGGPILATHAATSFQTRLTREAEERRHRDRTPGANGTRSFFYGTSTCRNVSNKPGIRYAPSTQNGKYLGVV